jgi:DNA-binding NarL/FixJ family response regulator/tetratricopeptide (TPR) repeat protein
MAGIVGMVGRERELGVVARFLAGSAGDARGLVLEGEAGIGKTALWEASLDAARERGLQVLVARAAEEEARFGFSGLADLLDGIEPAVLGRLPGPQRHALESALLLRDADQMSDPRALSAAVLGVMRTLAVAGVVVAVDDVGWLDPESAGVLAFAARRLVQEQVRFLFTRRVLPERPSPLERALTVERLEVAGLSFGAICQLWRVRLELILPRSTARRLYRTSAGNPLFALELARAVVARGGAIPIGGDVPLPAAVELVLSERVESVGEQARVALLAVELAGASRTGELATVVGPDALDEAVDTGLLRRDGEWLRLAHPLFGVVALARCPPAERRELHRRLAGAALDAERRAHHLAMATAGQDAEVATVAAAGAAAAARRGALVTAAALGEEVLRLTASASPEHASRLLAAAEYQHAAGNLGRTTELLVPALATFPRGSLRARALLLAADGNVADVDVAHRYATDALAESAGDPGLRARVLSWLALDEGLAQVARIDQANRRAAEAVRLAAAVGDPGGELEALAALVWVRNLRGLDSDEALARCQTLPGDIQVAPRMSAARARAVRLMWRGEHAAARTILADLLRLADQLGADESRFVIRLHLCELAVRVGDWAAVQRLLDEWSLHREEPVGSPAAFARCAALAAAGRGQVDQARQAAAAAVAAADAVGAQWHRLEALRASGMAELLAGDPAAAVHSLRGVWIHTQREGVEDPGAFPVAPDLVQALCMLELLDEAAEVAVALGAAAERQQHPWARVTAARCDGVLALAGRDHAAAAEALERAAAGYEQLALPFGQGRTLTLLGAAYRRLRRRTDARAVLEQSAGMLDALGSPGWAQRAREELARVGGRRRSSGLTPAEQRVAELVSQGKANKQIAAELVVSVGTVEHHLTRIYATLGVRSRSELIRLLLAD